MAGARRPGRFRPDEIDVADLGPGTEAELLGTARELEWLAATDDVGPGPGFADRVMAAVSREPVPQPVAAMLSAARRRSPLAALAALGDLWRVAFTGGRPLAARFPAMVLVVLLVVGSVGAGAVGAGALAGLLGRTPDATPALSPSPPAISSPEPTASPSPSASPEASESAEPSGQPGSTESPEPSDSLEPTEAPAETPAATEDHTARPTSTPSASEQPTETPSETPTPGETAEPGDTPNHTETPEPTSGSGGG